MDRGKVSIDSKKVAAALKAWRNLNAAERREVATALSEDERSALLETVQQVEVQQYKTLLVGSKKLSVDSLNGYFQAHVGENFETEEKPVIARAISWAVRTLRNDEEGISLLYVPEKGTPVPCTLTTQFMNGGAGRCFQVRASGGDRDRLAVKSWLPRLEIGRLSRG